MNALTTKPQNDADMVRVMRDSLYPGAKTESVEMVLAYCKARSLDPMLKPVHIVPMWIPAEKQMRDVPLPGIALYRIQAARSGLYTGKSEPEFGPDTTRELGNKRVTFPLWCKVTVERNGRPFTAKEFWVENYATAGKDTDAPNAMWSKRPYGQLAKVAEAQALRMAFPELTGGEATGEEMEGKSFAAEPMPPARGPTIEAAPPAAEPVKLPILSPDGEIKAVSPGSWTTALNRALAKLESAAAVRKWAEGMRPLLESIAEHLPDAADEFGAKLEARLRELVAEEAGEDGYTDAVLDAAEQGQ